MSPRQMGAPVPADPAAAAAPFIVGLLGHGTVGSAFAELLQQLVRPDDGTGLFGFRTRKIGGCCVRRNGGRRRTIEQTLRRVMRGKHQPNFRSYGADIQENPVFLISRP